MWQILKLGKVVLGTMLELGKAWLGRFLGTSLKLGAAWLAQTLKLGKAWRPTSCVVHALQLSGQFGDSLPEWSKGVDSSSTSESCVGSNPTAVILRLSDETLLARA